VDSQLHWRVPSSPLAIVGVLLYATARSVDDVSRQQYPTLAKWAVGGFLGAGVVGALVLGLQPVNDRVELAVVVFRPRSGARSVAPLAGVRIAQGATARANSEREWDRWRSLFRNAPAAIADLAIEDGTLVIVTANDAFREWFSVAETDEKQAFRSVVAADTDDVDLVSAVENGRTVVTTFSCRQPVSGDTIDYGSLLTVTGMSSSARTSCSPTVPTSRRWNRNSSGPSPNFRTRTTDSNGSRAS